MTIISGLIRIMISYDIFQKPAGVYNVDWKFCMRCSTIIEKIHVPEKRLKFTPFKSLKRCNECASKNISFAKKKKKSKELISFNQTLDPYQNLVVAILKVCKDDILDDKIAKEYVMQIQALNSKQTIILKNHIYSIFKFYLLDLPLPKIDYPWYFEHSNLIASIF